MDNLKEKEQKLLESLVRLDTITDLVVGSKKKIVDLQEVNAKTEELLSDWGSLVTGPDCCCMKIRYQTRGTTAKTRIGTNKATLLRGARIS